MKNSTIVSLIWLTLALPVIAAEPLALDEVTVKANRFERKDTDTTYASEIHTSAQIEASGAATLYDYLAQQTSINILSSYGNKATPSINLRGYGNETGYQNVVITVDGQRLNNIDQSSQLLGAIPVGNIERIEITKGSGSVLYGDGATAGAIQIYTKNKTGVTVSGSFGNYGQNNEYINAGISEQYFDLSASAARDHLDGFNVRDSSGNKDASTTYAQNLKLHIKPSDSLKIILEGNNSKNDFRYVNGLTVAEFKNNPKSNGGRIYTKQNIDADQYRYGIEYSITNALKITATQFQENKNSAFVAWYGAGEYDYDYRSKDVSLSYENEHISAIVGYQSFDGDRNANANDFGPANKTSKDNKAVFFNTEYRPAWIIEGLALSIGARQEKIEYKYKPSTGDFLKDTDNLNAWDIGFNYRINPKTSFYINYNKAFQTPDIDRFFAQDYTFFPTVTTGFNGFINPTKVKTLNLGINHLTSKNKFKFTIFHSNLDDEIYYNKAEDKNTNFDKTHKYGLEIQDTFLFNSKLNASLIYNYTRAIIDQEVGLSNNNDLPSTPKHTIVANLNYQFYENANFNLNHTYRSSAYSIGNFSNNSNFKQNEYESTNVTLSYKFNNYNIFVSINNIFEHKNSLAVVATDYDSSPYTDYNALYPVDFVRTWRVGMKADF
jgi:iron complex outermembrane receptor protein